MQLLPYLVTAAEFPTHYQPSANYEAETNYYTSSTYSSEHYYALECDYQKTVFKSLVCTYSFIHMTFYVYLVTLLWDLR